MKDETEGAADANPVFDRERLKALGAANIMDQAQDPAFDRAVRLAARLLDTPVSLLSFVDDTRQFFAAEIGLKGPVRTARGTPLSHSFCQYVVRDAAPLVVNDARNTALVQDNPAIEELDVEAYLGVPVRDAAGHVLGSFCAIDDKPRDWSDADLSAMRDIAAGLESELRLREALTAREVLLAEMSHRVKNLFTLVTSMVRMERRSHEDVATFADSVTGRIKALSDAHEMIVPLASVDQADGKGTDLGALLSKLLAPHSQGSTCRIQMSGHSVEIGPKAATYLALALHEMGTNAAKYGALAEIGGSLTIDWQTDGADEIRIDWVEGGKIWDVHAPMGEGFGTRLLRTSLEHQLGGRLERQVQPDSFVQRVWLPVAALRD